MSQLTYLAFAKINLGLKVLNKRLDGYHNIYSLFIELNFFDELYFSPSAKFSLKIDGPNRSNIPTDQTNLVDIAYRLIKKKYAQNKENYSIDLIKNIPTGSGLGGGSSNAATTLIALNNLWNLNLSNKHLYELGQKIGADVPFFIKGGSQIATGIGDILTPIKTNKLNKFHFVLVMPSVHISTASAYAHLNKGLHDDGNVDKFPPLLESINWELFENDFEQVVYTTYPEIRNIKVLMQESGALYAGLSGSGSTVFGIFDNQNKAEYILNQFNQYQTILTRPANR